MVKITDVARHAGVSPSTVSYALSGKRPISEATRLRVEEAIRRLGYRPHAGARALASSRSNVLALVVPLRAGIHVPVVRLPAQLTASGRAMLAALPAAQLRALFGEPSAFVLRTGLGPRSLSALRTLLVDTRRRGYAVEDGEVTPGWASVAAAVLDHSGHPVAGIAVTFPAAGMPEARHERIAVLVGRTADTLTRRIGGTPTKR